MFKETTNGLLKCLIKVITTQSVEMSIAFSLSFMDLFRMISYKKLLHIFQHV